MSISSFVGLCFVLIGSGLQEFAIYRRTMSRTQRKCNDSKATLLLYYSTGMCCEVTGLFLVSFYTYLIAGNREVVSSHILFQAYFAYQAPARNFYKLACGLLMLSIM